MKSKAVSSAAEAENDGPNVYVFHKPVPGEIIHFCHAGGKVTAQVLVINPDGSIRAKQDGKTIYPNVRESALMHEDETPHQWYGRTHKSSELPAANTGRSTARKPFSSANQHTSNAAPAVKKPGKGGSIIEQIIAHHVDGKSNAEIVALGFNKSTVARQVGEYKKRQQSK